MTKHNKKRNVGLIYELFMRHISTLLITDRKSEVKKATKIIESRFKKGTELYKEFRIFNALINSDIMSRETASNALNIAKNAVLSIDEKKLQREKSLLIKEIQN